MTKIHPVVLCGGSGTRLWPRSRKSKPKPFLPLIGERTMFEGTLGRCADPALFAPPVIVTGKDHLEHVEEQLAGAPGATVIVEPQAKNTAAAIALAAHRLPAHAVMLVCPSDHHIADEAGFHAAAAAAAQLAAQDWLVAFGIVATAPETGYGYIKQGESLCGGWRVERFVEKPDLDRARQLLAEGGYSWNGGIFAFRAGHFLDELARHRPELADAASRAVTGGREEGARFYPDAAAFAEIRGESVDYAVMEGTSRAAMVPASMGWSDIGSWAALREATDADDDGNSVRGRAELVDCAGVFVDTDGPRVSVIGLSDVAIVVDGDEVLVTTMEGAQKVGKLGGAANQ
jgi:mannose-1-phosphate guanylyltransferase/mannose-6-phosphate isomerase